ncbi:hypothetical protein MKX03_033556 [Papaver bracteatum]|nr:hypothetical protein MKX03_033556 [Papaver bracteatum]
MIRIRLDSVIRSNASSLLLLSSILLFFPSGTVSSGIVTLKSIQIFTTHGLLSRPMFSSYGLETATTVYFHCQGENKTDLPDVKKKNSLYTFKDEESWQPMTEFVNKKCKRCGFYEKNIIMSDDVFDEWEFCPSDFKAPDGVYVRLKDKEVSATFYCPECVPPGRDVVGRNHTLSSDNGDFKGNRMRATFVIFIAVLASNGFIIGVLYRYWLRKKSMQARSGRRHRLS